MCWKVMTFWLTKLGRVEGFTRVSSALATVARRACLKRAPWTWCLCATSLACICTTRPFGLKAERLGALTLTSDLRSNSATVHQASAGRFGAETPILLECLCCRRCLAPTRLSQDRVVHRKTRSSSAFLVGPLEVSCVLWSLPVCPRLAEVFFRTFALHVALCARRMSEFVAVVLSSGCPSSFV